MHYTFNYLLLTLYFFFFHYSIFFKWVPLDNSTTLHTFPYISIIKEEKKRKNMGCGGKKKSEKVEIKNKKK